VAGICGVGVDVVAFLAMGLSKELCVVDMWVLLANAAREGLRSLPWYVHALGVRSELIFLPNVSIGLPFDSGETAWAEVVGPEGLRRDVITDR